MRGDFPDFLDMDANSAARRLLGCYLVSGGMLGESVVKIVETESYDQTDAASHSCRGETLRTKIMFGPSGFLYVYFTYGMYYCCNVVTGPADEGAAVLIRAVEPIEGEDMLATRRKKSGVQLTNGPAKLCQAMGIDMSMSGHDLRMDPFRLIVGETVDDLEVVRTTRIGISQAKDELRRFYIKGNEYVSKV